MRTKEFRVRDMEHLHDLLDRCCVCNKPITSKIIYLGHLVKGGHTLLHPDDEEQYVPDGSDVGCHHFGPDCARKIGLEWFFKTNREELK